jgi:hypothetical protein
MMSIIHSCGLKKAFFLGPILILIFFVSLFSCDLSALIGKGNGNSAPSAPSSVAATAGNAQIIISWPTVSDANAYNIYWATTSSFTITGSCTKITGATSPYAHIGLSGGTTYYYYVTAVGSGGESSPSSQVSATPIIIPTPTGVVATPGNTQVTLSWTGVTGALCYNIYWATTSGFTVTESLRISTTKTKFSTVYTVGTKAISGAKDISGNGTQTTTSGTQIPGIQSPYTQTGLTNGTTYYYVVTAVTTAGESSPSIQVNCTPSATAPIAGPTGVTAAPGNTQVTISWTGVSGATSYNIYWATTSGFATSAGTKVPGVTSPYTVTGLANGTTYYFVVTAVESAGESSPSSQVNAIPAPSAQAGPIGVTATAGNAQITISWMPVAGAISYNLYWSTTSGVTTSSGTKIAGITSPYTHTGLTNGTTYYYVVTVITAAGESSPSSQVDAISGGVASLIVSFAFLTSNNSALTQNYTATIAPPNVSIEVPDSIIQNQTPLTATVTMQSGYTLTSPTGAFYPSNGMSLSILNTSTNVVSTYTLLVSVDPGTLAFLNISTPFYINSGGSTIAFTAPQYTLSPSGNTYTVTLNTDSFSLPYPAYAVQNIITSRPVGFSSVSVPYGSFTTNLAAAQAGAVCPYTVTVQSSNRSYTNTYTVQAARTKSNVVSITDVSVTYSYVYYYAITQAYSDGTLSNFLNSAWSQQGNDTEQDTYPLSLSNDWETWWVSFDRSGAGSISNQQVFFTNQGWSGQYSNQVDYLNITTPGGTINSNNSSLNGLLAAPQYGYTVVGSPVTVDYGTSLTISSSVSAPGVGNSMSGLSPTLSVSGSITASTSVSGTEEYTGVASTARSFSVPVTQTTSYAGQSWPSFSSIVVEFPHYNTINQIAPTSYVSSWTQTVSGDGNNWVITLYIAPTLSHWTGKVCQMTLAAETGTTSIFTVAVD